MRALAEAGDQVEEERPGGVEQAPAARNLGHGIDAPAQTVGAGVRVAVDEAVLRQRRKRARDLGLLAAHHARHAGHAQPALGRGLVAREREKRLDAPTDAGLALGHRRPKLPGGVPRDQARARRTASTRPPTSCGSASTAGSTPHSRRVALVTGPIDAAVSPSRPRGAEGGGEVRDGRRRRERHQVGCRARRPPPPARAPCGRGGRRRPWRPARAGRRAARRGRPRAVATSTRRPATSPSAPSSDSETASSGTTSATIPRARSAATVARADRGHAHAVQRAHVAGQEQLDAVCARHADHVVGGQVGRVERQRLDPDRRAPGRHPRRAPRAGPRARSPAPARG